ncbi:APC amino acid permease [Fimicolochytrium jonesii]|uniref:APC amino acid permease n=1 Tax=Fimicolochytrium jonesii TaxID=1396493 RepID=UPI0022FE48EF|nr:APC amino acid permease [Fimicolochytrium jonesii]KAI8824512.1 APC amino acid permease [Fimicolochytrium jonesii]
MSSSADVVVSEAGGHHMTDDEIRLAKLGYKQGLKRQFSAFQNFGFVLTNASVLIGVVPLFSFAMAVGGPVTFTWGWLLVSSFVMCVGLSMAEICSTYPTAGGLYYWTAKLGGPKWGPLFSWFEAWFNALGQVAGASGSVLSASQLMAEMIRIGSGRVLVEKEIFGLFCAMVISGALVNVIGGLGLKATSIASVYVHILGTFIIVIVLLVTCKDKNSASFVFTDFEDQIGATQHGFAPFFVFLLGLLPSQWSLLGYDSSAHMSEETEASYVNGPRGIVYTIIAAVIMGWGLILSMTFALGDYATAQAETSFYAAPTAAYVFTRNAGDAGGMVLLFIVVFAGWCCGIGTMAANSRMFYAFARDNGLPASKFWTKLDARTGMPIRLVFLSATFVIILAIPYMFSAAALTAVAGISVIGFMVSYSIPIFLRITVGDKYFVQSEFNLGRWSYLLGWIGVIWTAIACVLFNFPQAYPAAAETLNYTPVAVGFLLLYSGGTWMLGARKWFKGGSSRLSASVGFAGSMLPVRRVSQYLCFCVS